MGKKKSSASFADVVEATLNPDRRKVLGLGLDLEFDRNFYNTKSYDLEKLGLASVPVASRMINARYATPSPWHVHEECIEIICCHHGSCEYETEDGRVHLVPGDAFVSRPDEPHRQLTNPRRFSTYCLFVRLPKRSRHGETRDETMAWFADRLRKMPRAVDVGRNGVNRLGRLFKLLDEGRIKGLERTIRLKAIVVAFLLDLLDATERPSRKDVRASIREVVREMASYPERTYSADKLMTRLSMSPTALLGAFKQATGFSPHAYLIKCRIDRAKDMLEQGMPVGRVATALGFRSRRYFTAMFHKSTGSTPLNWLKEKGVR